MSLSGSVLVLRPYIEDLLRPAWTSKSIERPAQILTAASQSIATRWPGSQIASVGFPVRSGQPIEFGIRTADDGELRVFADAWSGEVLGTFSLPWLEWTTELHHHLLVQGPGKKIVGFIGVFLVFSSLTGLWIWARRANPWRLIRARKLTSFDLHRSVGVIGNLLLLFVAVTGVVISFPQTITQLLGGPPAADRLRTRGQAKNPVARATLDDYVSAAKRAVPGGEIVRLRLPSGPSRQVMARLRMAGDLSQEGSTRITFESGTTHVLALDRPEEWAFSKEIVRAALPLHHAEWGGFPLRLFWCLIGLMPPALFVSGVMMWWTPFGARRKAARIAATRDLAREENPVA
jgi:uncharacterized iron-regulated membrane protein